MPPRRLHLAATVFLATIVRFAAAEEAASPAKRGGLVELYPSQGCDMCPAAENLGISGENAGKTLIARYPARRTEYDFVELSGSAPVSRQFSFTIDPSWDRDQLRLACFVQDKRTAIVHQAVDLPWQGLPAK